MDVVYNNRSSSMHNTTETRRHRQAARYRRAKRLADAFSLRRACTIIALYIVSQHPFVRVLRDCRRYGGYRNGRRGTKTRRAARHLGINLRLIPKRTYHDHRDELFRAGRILRKAGFRRGYYLVFTSRHVSVVVDGRLLDWTYTARDPRPIRSIYRVLGS